VQLNFNQKPADKLQFIKNLQQNGERVMMVGDGLNDAGALRQSNIGIAVTENNNNFTPACDAILEGQEFGKLPVFFEFARRGKWVIVLSFTFSVVYNVVGLTFALQGKLSPLVAAILMPMSSITIIALTFSLSQFFAWRAGLLDHEKSHILA
jgi:Cu+-exporting ATPase